MTSSDKTKFLIFRTLGNFFILFTIFGFFATFGPALYYEFQYRVGRAYGVEFKLAEEPKPKISELGKIIETTNKGTESTRQNESFLGSVLAGEKEQILVPRSTDFSIVIPKIGASEAITANVDPSNEKEYLEVLNHSIAHAKGSAFPGLNGTTYLFAHSADNFWNVGRYNAVFYLLKELVPGDDIAVFFQGKRYNYKVSETKIADADDTSYINSNIGKGEQLVLQTCWPPGTTWKRLFVFAKPIK